MLTNSKFKLCINGVTLSEANSLVTEILPFAQNDNNAYFQNRNGITICISNKGENHVYVPFI